MWFRRVFFICFSRVKENLNGVSFLSASFSSWEKHYLNGPSGSFLQHFLLLGMLRGVFQCNRKHFDLSLFQQVIRSRTRSSLSCCFFEIKINCVRKRPTDCQKNKKKRFVFISQLQTICDTQSHSSPHDLAKVSEHFLAHSFVFGFVWNNKHSHCWHWLCCHCRKHKRCWDPGVVEAMNWGYCVWQMLGRRLTD